jgi:hypothetical protein
MVPLIAERLSGLIGRSVTEIAAVTTRNAEQVFGFSAPVAAA